MCDGNNHYLIIAKAVEYIEGESLKNEFARSMFGQEVSRWAFSDS